MVSGMDLCIISNLSVVLDAICEIRALQKSVLHGVH